MRNDLHVISGLPRSGSTLLAALLRHNPAMHAHITSPVGAMVGALLAGMSAGSETSVFIDEAQRTARPRGLFENDYGVRQAGKMIFAGSSGDDGAGGGAGLGRGGLGRGNRRTNVIRCRLSHEGEPMVSDSSAPEVSRAPPRGGTSVPDPLLVEAARLAALPTFRQAVREYTIRAARFRQGPQIINRLISHDKRWRVVALLICLALDSERYGPKGGATYARLLDICTRQLEISPRVLKTVLALLQLSGFVRTVRSDADRRSKHYQPTARALAFVDDWLSYAVNTLDILEPEMQRARMLREDPGFAERFMVHAGRARLEDEPLVNRMPDYIALFGRRHGATAALLAVVLADMDQTETPSRNEIAARFSLSKTQVNTIFADAEVGGFMIMEGGKPRPTALLLESHRHWISIELAFYAQHMKPLEAEAK